nr:MAG TPA: hypothetical protein [Caudoviricetes sp.]
MRQARGAQIAGYLAGNKLVGPTHATVLFHCGIDSKR